eukprot:14220454-Ditylum_brightwellii.AAC.1
MAECISFQCGSVGDACKAFIQGKKLDAILEFFAAEGAIVGPDKFDCHVEAFCFLLHLKFAGYG